MAASLDREVRLPQAVLQVPEGIVSLNVGTELNWGRVLFPAPWSIGGNLGLERLLVA